jgi:hypothetical protein
MISTDLFFAYVITYTTSSTLGSASVSQPLTVVVCSIFRFFRSASFRFFFVWQKMMTAHWHHCAAAHTLRGKKCLAHIRIFGFSRTGIMHTCKLSCSAMCPYRTTTLHHFTPTQRNFSDKCRRRPLSSMIGHQALFLN